MTENPNVAWSAVKSWLSNVGSVASVASFFGLSSATFVAYLWDSRRLTVLFSVLTTFVAVFLIVDAAPPFFQWLRYRWNPPKTTVELIGGNSLTLVIQNKGLPIKVRARATFSEFGEDMESHAAPYDLMLFTRTFGGRHELIELNHSFDMAKSIFGELKRLPKDAGELTVERPGLSSFWAVAQDGSSVLAYLFITVTILSPLGPTEVRKKYRLHVRPKGIGIIDDTEHVGA